VLDVAVHAECDGLVVVGRGDVEASRAYVAEFLFSPFASGGLTVVRLEGFQVIAEPGCNRRPNCDPVVVGIPKL
jgi:hypothetical protein